MSDNASNNSSKTLEEIGIEILPVNTGQGKVHAKRIGGFFRNFKWWAASFWIILFVGPYMRWNGEQAILWDIPNRQFNIFGLTILPQDIWMLSLILLFFALLLAVSTAIAGRVWCGYFCFQTVWTDVFTWIEEKIEGQPHKRQKLDEQPMNMEKLQKRVLKHSAWLFISFMTAFSFIAYFVDVFELWGQLFTLTASGYVWAELLVIGILTYLAAGIMREQICLWVCPYARIQGAMVDQETIMPTYDKDRGEPRGRLKRSKKDTEDEATKQGDCIDCNLCVAVCPTGIDIRQGQQYGCITCGLCIDACDSVMDKLKKPRGLVRYASIADFAGVELPPIYKRPRVIVYSTIMAAAFAGILYGFIAMAPMTMNVLHERNPLFVQLSTGEVQNKYTIKVVNKTDKVMNVELSVEGIEGIRMTGVDGLIEVQPGNVHGLSAFVKAPKRNLSGESTPIKIKAYNVDNPEQKVIYDSMFIGPRY